MNILTGDCLKLCAEQEPDTVDAVVTDPPYHLTQVSRKGSPRNNDPDSPFGRHNIGERGFMGKAWDGGDVAMRPETWAAFLRIAKPGAHLVAFGGTRTYHRVACAIEDAGFEIRDSIMWLYGSGFPKSLDVGKAIDKAAGAERKVVGVKSVGNGNKRGDGFRHEGDRDGLPVTVPATADAEQWAGWGTGLKPAFEPIIVGYRPLTAELFLAILCEDIRERLCRLLPAQDAQKAFIDTRAKSHEVARSVPALARTYELENSENVRFAARRFTCTSRGSNEATGDSVQGNAKDSGSQPQTSETETRLGEVDDFLTRLVGTSTSGKTANISANTVSRWNSISGDLLIQANTYTIATGIRLTTALTTLRSFLHQITIDDTGNSSLDLDPGYEPIILARKPFEGTVADNVKRWGTGGLNIDGCRVEGDARPLLDARAKTTPSQFGAMGGSKAIGETTQGRWPANVALDQDAAAMLDQQSGTLTSGTMKDTPRANRGGYAGPMTAIAFGHGGDSGGASRFFYTSKASTAERGEDNTHPTVKPLDLMRWLCRLVTPPGGLILDPFTGSGTTAVAALREGFGFLGCELDPAYAQIAQDRIIAARADLGTLKADETPDNDKALQLGLLGLIK